MIDRTSCLRAALFAGAALVAMPLPTAPLAAQTVPAPQAGPDGVIADAREGDDVVVIARRREERLLDVPIAVSAL